jgi:hypothetical protein
MNSGHRQRRGPGIGATFGERYEATTLVPGAKQAPRRIPVRWYPTHGYQHERPSPLQAPSSLMARDLKGNQAPSSTRDPTTEMALDEWKSYQRCRSPAADRATAGSEARRQVERPVMRSWWLTLDIRYEYLDIGRCPTSPCSGSGRHASTFAPSRGTRGRNVSTTLRHRRPAFTVELRPSRGA